MEWVWEVPHLQLALRFTFAVLALSAVWGMHWVLGPEGPPPAMPNVANIVVFWHLGGTAPTGLANCRRYIRGVEENMRNVLDSPVYKSRNAQIRLVMPGICAGPDACPSSRWPKMLQTQLFSRFKVEERSHTVNCTDEGPYLRTGESTKTLERQRLPLVLTRMRAHCQRSPHDLVAYMRTGRPPQYVSMFEDRSRKAELEGLLGRTGEQECLRNCFGPALPGTMACGPNIPWPSRSANHGIIQHKRPEPAYPYPAKATTLNFGGGAPMAEHNRLEQTRRSQAHQRQARHLRSTAGRPRTPPSGTAALESTLGGTHWWVRCSDFSRVSAMALAASGFNSSHAASPSEAHLTRGARGTGTQCWRRGPP